MVAVTGTTRTAVATTTGDRVVRTPGKIQLVILDPELVQAPTSVQATVATATPGATLTFAIDGTTVWTATADAEGSLGQTSLPVPAGTTSGQHTLSVTDGASSGTATFTLDKGPAMFPVNQTADADPVFIDGSEGRWVFQDLMPGGLGSWVLPIGPGAMSAPQVTRALDVQHTTSPHGRYHVTEASLSVPAWRLSGYCPDKAYYDQLMAYGELRRRIYIIDHRGRAWVVAISSCKVEPRKRQITDAGTWNDWAGNWELVADILDQKWVQPV